MILRDGLCSRWARPLRQPLPHAKLSRQGRAWPETILDAPDGEVAYRTREAIQPASRRTQ